MIQSICFSFIHVIIFHLHFMLQSMCLIHPCHLSGFMIGSIVFNFHPCHQSLSSFYDTIHGYNFIHIRCHLFSGYQTSFGEFWYMSTILLANLSYSSILWLSSISFLVWSLITVQIKFHVSHYYSCISSIHLSNFIMSSISHPYVHWYNYVEHFKLWNQFHPPHQIIFFPSTSPNNLGWYIVFPWWNVD